MYALMLTGGIGSGKTTVCAHLVEKGAMRIDTDEVARDIRESGDVTDALIERFGEQILDASGDVSAFRLADAAFATQEATDALDAIMHPLILQRTAELLMASPCVPTSAPKVAVVEVPLLVPESPFLGLADEVMAICAPVDERVIRAISRGMNEDDVRERICRQITDEQRASIADTVIVNDGTLADLHRAIDEWWRERESAGWPSIRGQGVARDGECDSCGEGA